MKNLWGATVIATLIYFILSFLNGIWFENTGYTTAGQAAVSLVKAGVFGLVFHYAHSFIAHMLGWYDFDPELDAPRKPVEAADNTEDAE